MRPVALLPLWGASSLCVLPPLSRVVHAAQPQRPNVVLIIADDMAWDDCGAYGNKTIKTPRIDLLAREGMLSHPHFTAT